MSAFVFAVEAELMLKRKHNKTSIEKLAASYRITDKIQIKELVELAIVKQARRIAKGEGTVRAKFEQIVELYQLQVNLSHRTSQSILLQQYSTPAPISYLAGIFCELDKLGQNGGYGFEPSAGNGLLTVAGDPARIYVNEIDPLRNSNLMKQGFANVWKRDATNPFFDVENTFIAVLTNPPFGKLDNPVMFDTFKIDTLDHLMALRALETMTSDGRAAIIVGGHTKWDDKGRIQAGRNRIFFNYLYSRYHIADVLQIDGGKLYSRQGTSFDVRLVLINGRKQRPGGAAPVKNKEKDKAITTFDQLYERMAEAMNGTIDQSDMSINELEREALALQRYFQPTHPQDEEDDDTVDHPKLFEHYQRLKNGNPDTIYLFETAETFCTFNEDANIVAQILKLGMIKYSSGNVRFEMTGVSKQFISIHLDTLKEAGHDVATILDKRFHTREAYQKLQDETMKMLKIYFDKMGNLGAPYMPASDSCVVLNTQVPDSMAFETQSAISQIKEEVGGDIDNFVRHRLQFPSKAALCKALSAEQIDAVAMAIYNIEARGQGMIIGDQTGIGKGRIAASVIRYAVCQGLKPVFLTEKANLFSDIYRDLSAIGSGHLQPLIVNSREAKTDIKDEDGNVVYSAPSVAEQQAIFTSRQVPSKYDFVVATYSQFNSPEKKPEKPLFLQAIAEGNIFILDEAHNSSGSSNTGEFLQRVVGHTKGVAFLSATFAKRPDNMPIYAMKTAIADCNMSKTELVEAITRGGVALQEVLSSQLVAEGQMLRRERSFEGVEVNYISLDEKAEEHRAIADNITGILRDIIAFQNSHIDAVVEELDQAAVAEGKEIEIREGTSQAGVDNLPYFSKVFQVINQMLFSLKAEAVAERAIMRLQEGKKPVIAFASTMGSFIENIENEKGLPVSDGDIINADFTEVLKRGLDGILRYTEKDVDGNPIYKKFELSDLSQEAQMEYHRIYEKIKTASTGITISPIDVIVKKLTDAGYTVAEVTGRRYGLQLNTKTGKGLAVSRKKINTNDAFRQFNNNEVDVLMINQSGSTGASAHAIPTAKVPASEVRQRVMIVLQAELDINTEVQKRGRINRTGQILKPIYDYVTSAIPAEKRLMMMLQKKLKSLDANTTSNQKQSTKILDVPDFLNKYGDKIVKEYLSENQDINELLDDPLSMKDSGSDSGEVSVTEDAAHKVSGRVAVLSTKMQQDFYNEIAERYNDYEAYLKQIGEYDLEVEAMNLDAETLSSKVVKMGKGSDSAFGDDSILDTVRANVLKKPFSRTDLSNLLSESLSDKNGLEIQKELIDEYTEEWKKKLFEEQQEVAAKWDEILKNVPSEKKIKKLEANNTDWLEAIKEREKEIETARQQQNRLTEIKANNRRQYLEKIFRFFYVGRSLHYPIETFTSGNELVPAVFLGYGIDRRKKNPYAPSLIKLRFAIANSSKYFAIPASYSEEVMAIIGASADMRQPDKETLLDQWESYTSQNNVDRKIRHIITGNLLQAFSDFKGKLVSYTTIDGKTLKGILMPENWNPGEQVQDKVVVPIIKALPLLKSLVNGHHIITNNGISFFRQGSYYKVIVPGSRAKGGDIYLDKR
ncbi:MAG TPA: strawberry notch C-terminal domain-containing protein, partial [Flavipsychrobacter sp.]|nr:strawberry notch C-terminal domain-containing protein [Flavipsychrobacter sp.]